MMDNGILWLIILALLVIVVLFVLRARRKSSRDTGSGRWAGETTSPAYSRPPADAASSVESAPPEQAGSGQTWAPPHYAATSQAITGPSLKVGIGIIRTQGENLLVSWNAVNDGSAPVEVQWGAPRVEMSGDDTLILRYTHPPSDGPFDPPETRTHAPGEILSRSATVAKASVGRDLAGLRVTVALGYGPVEGYEAASADGPSYAAWQKTAVSAPRVVPKG